VERIGRYALVEQLGVGGMAEVFKARTTGPSGFERTVVIKRIHPDFCDDPEFVSMFVAEARILGLLHHANVVQVYDFGEADGRLFLVLELVDGPSLAKVISGLVAAKRQIPPAIAAHFAHEVCRALEYVHTLRDADGAPLGVVHRDVTPSNILLTSTGGLKLLDFGVAKYGTSKVRSQHKTMKGKAAYLAPETIEGKPIDGRVDVFALGIVLHELLTLTSLFAHHDSLVTLHKALTKPIEPPSLSHPDVPPELDAVVLKALSRDLGRRYTSAGEMAHDLNEIVLSSRLRTDQIMGFMREVMAHGAAVPAAMLPAVVSDEESTPAMASFCFERLPEAGAPAPRPMSRLRESRLARWLLGRRHPV
jgi:serine/threonine-protein kinase